MNLRDFHLRPTWDHIVPASRGGREKIVCCLKCNGIKGDMMPDAWTAYMAANPGWWLLTRADRKRRNKEARLAGGPTNHGVMIRRQTERQGQPPPGPVVVPPHLIYNLSLWPEARSCETPC